MTTNTLDRKHVIFNFSKKLYENFISKREGLEELTKPINTPLLILDIQGIRNKYREAKRCFGEFDIFYAVKANDHYAIIEALSEERAGFEVASSSELEKVFEYCKEPSRIISSNPVKPMDFIAFAHQKGIDLFAVDSFTEVEKISDIAPRSRIYVRLAVPNEGSDWPLSGKFGVDPVTAVEILEYARSKGLIPYGITFHVGSQCNNLRNWFLAVKLTAEAWNRARQKGIRLKLLNIGGGIPVTYLSKSLSMEDIAYYVRGLLRKYMIEQPAELHMEPGRGLVGDQGMLVARVIGKAVREGTRWIYIDTGVFNGLAEALGGIRYPFYINKEGELYEWTVGGISCDSMDVIARNVPLPEPEVGDYVYIMSAGAYTTVYGSNFNGFPVPQILSLK